MIYKYSVVGVVNGCGLTHWYVSTIGPLVICCIIQEKTANGPLAGSTCSSYYCIHLYNNYVHDNV